jgi:hypothetical protein
MDFTKIRRTRFERVGDNTLRITDGPDDELEVMMLDAEGNDVEAIPAHYEGDALVLVLPKPLTTISITIRFS